MSSTRTKVLICPYCGDTQSATERCRVCGGLFEPLSRQASHNAMGPWFVRDEQRPFQPGASYETIVKLIERGLVNRYTILRSPTTKQFWTVARRVPGIAHLLGYCHNCDATVGKDDHGCPSCGVPFGAYLDRNYMGLPDVKPLPWEAPIVESGRKGGSIRGFAPMSPAGGAVDIRGAAEPLGLSSFASDEELRAAHAPQAVQGTPGVTAYEGASAHAGATNGEASLTTLAHAEASISPATPAVEPAPSTPVHSEIGSVRGIASADVVAARALNRRLQQQQSTIRLLMIGLGAIALLAAVIIIALVARMGQMQQSASQGDAKSNPSVVEQGDQPPASGVPAATAPDEPATQPLEQEPPAASMPASDLAPPPVAVEDFAANLDKAASLLIDARKETRPLKDRIKDAETAAALLKSVKAQAAASQQPADLDQRIVEADRLVERLKLQEFFP